MAAMCSAGGAAVSRQKHHLMTITSVTAANTAATPTAATATSTQPTMPADNEVLRHLKMPQTCSSASSHMKKAGHTPARMKSSSQHQQQAMMPADSSSPSPSALSSSLLTKLSASSSTSTSATSCDAAPACYLTPSMFATQYDSTSHRQQNPPPHQHTNTAHSSNPLSSLQSLVETIQKPNQLVNATAASISMVKPSHTAFKSSPFNNGFADQLAAFKLARNPMNSHNTNNNNNHHHNNMNMNNNDEANNANNNVNKLVKPCSESSKFISENLFSPLLCLNSLVSAATSISSSGTFFPPVSSSASFSQSTPTSNLTTPTAVAATADSCFKPPATLTESLGLLQSAPFSKLTTDLSSSEKSLQEMIQATCWYLQIGRLLGGADPNLAATAAAGGVSAPSSFQEMLLGRSSSSISNDPTTSFPNSFSARPSSQLFGNTNNNNSNINMNNINNNNNNSNTTNNNNNSSMNGISHHLTSGSGKKTQCHLCQKPFANKGQLRLHLSKRKCPSMHLRNSIHSANNASSRNEASPILHKSVAAAVAATGNNGAVQSAAYPQLNESSSSSPYSALKNIAMLSLHAGGTTPLDSDATTPSSAADNRTAVADGSTTTTNNNGNSDDTLDTTVSLLSNLLGKFDASSSRSLSATAAILSSLFVKKLMNFAPTNHVSNTLITGDSNNNNNISDTDNNNDKNKDDMQDDKIADNATFTIDDAAELSRTERTVDASQEGVQLEKAATEKTDCADEDITNLSANQKADIVITGDVQNKSSSGGGESDSNSNNVQTECFQVIQNNFVKEYFRRIHDENGELHSHQQQPPDQSKETSLESDIQS